MEFGQYNTTEQPTKPTVEDTSQLLSSTESLLTTTIQNGGNKGHPMLEGDLIDDDSSRFILIPLAFLVGILILSALVFLMARNRRQLSHIYCKHRRTTNFTDAKTRLEPGLMVDTDSDFDFDDPSECLLKGKLQIDHKRYDSYTTTQVSQAPATAENNYNRSIRI